MAKPEKIDVFNRGTRTYTSQSGIAVPGGQTTQLPREEGEALLKGYPVDLISPDDLKSVPASREEAALRDEIEKLQGQVSTLEADKKTLENKVQELESKVSELSKTSTGIGPANPHGGK